MVTAPPTDDEIQAFFDENFLKMPPPPCAELLGWHGISFDVESQSAEILFRGTEKMLNPAGTIQGGFLAAMLDDTMGPLVVIMSAGRAFPTTTDLHIQYFRPGQVGVIRAKAHITRMGRNLSCTAAELYNEKGEIICSAIQTAMLIRPSA